MIDAIDIAMERTRKCLIEPFDLIKWLKLALIVFFVGGASGYNGGGNYGGNSYNPDTGLSDLPGGAASSLSHIGNYVYEHLSMLIVGIIAFLLLYIIIMSLIGSVMEFVFVESLVSNDVQLIRYFSRYFGKGITLLIFKLILSLILLIPIGILALIFIMLVGADIYNGGILFSILFITAFLFLLLLFVVLATMVFSFLSMAVPVSMYTGKSIFDAFGNVLQQFRADWKQIFIYWIGRGLLSIAAGIITTIAGLIGAVIMLIAFLVIDLILYLAFTAVLPETGAWIAPVWIILIPVLIVEFIILLFAMAFISMPVRVFMKYHMLSFLEKWYSVNIPFFAPLPSGEEVSIAE